jgi:hypothetical protein
MGIDVENWEKVKSPVFYVPSQKEWQTQEKKLVLGTTGYRVPRDSPE